LKGVVLTKDNLAKCNWQGNKKCVFCNSDESIQHLFLTAILFITCGDCYLFALV
jgi:hypothetical protein